MCSRMAEMGRKGMKTASWVDGWLRPESRTESSVDFRRLLVRSQKAELHQANISAPFSSQSAKSGTESTHTCASVAALHTSTHPGTVACSGTRHALGHRPTALGWRWVAEPGHALIGSVAALLSLRENRTVLPLRRGCQAPNRRSRSVPAIAFV